MVVFIIYILSIESTSSTDMTDTTESKITETKKEFTWEDQLQILGRWYTSHLPQMDQ